VGDLALQIKKSGQELPRAPGLSVQVLSNL